MNLLDLPCRSRLWRRPWWLGWMLCGLLLCMAPARAHLIAAQKGTLNLVGDAALLVLSVPVSALRGVDDNGDAALSTAEFRAHAGPSARRCSRACSFWGRKAHYRCNW